MCANRPRSQRFFPYGSQAGALRLLRACQALGIPPHLWTLGSLRPGGATFEFLNGASTSMLRFRGRWRQEATLDHYINESCAYLDVASLQLDTLESVDALASLAQHIIGSFLATGREGQ